MKIGVFAKDIRRSISHSWGRFWAIFVIVALGSGFYAGLRATAPDMRITGDAYFDDGNMMDLRLLSAFGFSEADVEAIREIPGVKGVMAGHTADVLSRLEEEDQVLRVHSLPTDIGDDSEDFINRPVLVEGRMPETSGECLVSRNKTGTGVEIGDTITFSSEGWEDSFDRQEFTVVGLVDSSYYIAFSLGSTSLGNGTLSRYMFVLDEDFNQSAITDLFVTVEGAREESTFSDSYEELVAEVKSRLEELGEERDDIRYEEVLRDSRQELEDGWTEYEEKKEEAELQFQEAEDELLEAEGKLEESRAQLEAGRLEYETGKAELDAAQGEYDAAREEYEDGRSQWLGGYSEYLAGLQEYQDGLSQYREGMQQLEDAEQQLKDGEQQLEESRPLYETAKELRDKISQAEALSLREAASRESSARATSMEELLEQLKDLTPEQLKPLLDQMDPETVLLLKAYLDQVIQEYETGAKELEEGRKELEKQKAENLPRLQQAEQELAEAKTKLEEAKLQLDTSKARLEEGRKQLQEARNQLQEGKEALAASQKELSDGETRLKEGEKELEAGKAQWSEEKSKAEKELEDARKKLEKAQRTLDETSIPEWYVLTRDTNVGYASFEADTGRMESLSTVLPVIFFLVAALVALTTMTRMVEEERGLIGTYKALGYGKARIAGKYLIYASLATVGGCVCGVLLGFLSLPTICWNAYRMLYTAPDLAAHFNWEYGLIGSAASLFCTLGATTAACWSTLAETPASLMQPKAPKAGKRILLERIPFLWKRLKFTQKVTCRNLFRYKKRLIMTIVGIAGCTGLLVTGFGIKDSISGILSNQYEKIYDFNFTATLEDGELSEEAREVLDDPDLFSGWFLSHKASADVSCGDSSMSGYLFVPEHAEDLKNFINLQDRVSGADVPFEKDSVVVTEKLADRLGITVGSTITLRNSSGTRISFTVTGITENYVYHYVYMDPDLYEEKMGETLTFTEINALCLPEDPAEQQAAADRMLEAEGIATAAFTDSATEMLENMIQSLDFIILVIVICAGALAFVVLYNLTNINVTERQRELATIKVLGFFDREVSAYIYRETVLLTVLGCIAGLFFGVVLHSFVIQTVEVDMVMFGREVAPLSFLWSGLITMGFSVIVNLFMNRKLRKIDMVESLKSVE